MQRTILTGAAVRALEQHHSELPLMERAGQAAAQLACRMQASLQGPPLIFAGPGNNGGDALVTARLLKQRGLDPVVVFLGDPACLPHDARNAFLAWQGAGGRCHEKLTKQGKGRFGLVIDGLFGIGLSRPLSGPHAALIEDINHYAGPVLALDCPSGLDADTGAVLGTAVRATHTLTFMALKPGMLTLDGPDHCGEITVDELGLDIATDDANTGRVLAREDFSQWLKPRQRNSHKGSFGSVGIIGGAPGMAGAALLAARAALRLGTGRVYVGMLESLPVDVRQAELMLRPTEQVIELADAIALGPGLGQSNLALVLLRQAIATDKALLLDADALNLLAAHPVLAHRLARRPAPTLLTPHPAEAARLLGYTVDKVQADRLQAARSLAKRFNAGILLKGCGSIVVNAEDRWAINTNGNPGMASAGQGDILSGLSVALLAQDWPPFEALAAAVHLHGAAADACVADGIGPVGLTASETIDAARRLFNRWIADSA